MRVLALDNDADSRSVLVTRLEAALREANLRRVEVIESDVTGLLALVAEAPPTVAILGPGCYSDLEHCINRCRASYPKIPLALWLSNEIYASEAVELRRSLRVRVMPIADLGQMAQFLLDCDALGSGSRPRATHGTVMVLQCKGGVGATSMAAALAACWARNQMSVALFDLDDVNPQLTEWARVGASQRRLITDAVRAGPVKAYKLRELLCPVDGYDGHLLVLGQPEHYGEGFHFKADVLEGAPSSSEYVVSALEELDQEYDVVVVDAGRSWGVATFAALQVVDRVVCVIDDDAVSLHRTLETVTRMARESDEASEFNFQKWEFVINAFTGRVLEEHDILEQLRRRELISDNGTCTKIPYADAGREWGLTASTLYELGGPDAQEALAALAYRLVPFQFEPHETALYRRLRRKIFRLVS